MSVKYSSKGTLLQRDVATVFTTVAAVKSLSGPDAEVQFFDGTALDSGVSMEDGELTGHTSPGSVTGELFYDPADAQHQAMTDDLGAPTARNWRIKCPDGTAVIAFNGTVQKCTPKASVGDGFMADFGIKLRSLATYPT